MGSEMCIRDSVSNRVIVKFRTDNATASAKSKLTSNKLPSSLLAEIGEESTRSITLSSQQRGKFKSNTAAEEILIVDLDGSKTPQEAIAILENNSTVEWAQLDLVHRQELDSNSLTTQNIKSKSLGSKMSLPLSTPPNDPLYPEQSYLNSTDPDVFDIDAPEAWEINNGNPDSVVAIIGSGVMWRHEDLQGKLWVNPGEIPDNGIDDDGNGYIDDINGIACDNNTSPDDSHSTRTLPDFEFVRGFRSISIGTSAAGIIAATTNNELGIAGIDHQTKIMPIRYCLLYTSDAADEG